MKIEPYLMSLLASRIGSISVQMNNVMVKGARSSVLALARDCSTAICDANGDVLAFPAGFPMHVGGSTLLGRSLLEIHGKDLQPGDAYLNNSPYHGNTHAADHTIIVPVFLENELMFLAVCRGHQADVGNSIPTTYHARARDVYQEGALIFPCVRVQRDYQDVEDIIRMCRMRIRVPDVWYGDYLAMIGAARIGERELEKLARKYGAETIRAFFQQYHAYGEECMRARIALLPAGRACYETHYDPVPGVLPNGLTVSAAVEVQPEKGSIIVDFTANEDSQPCGLNMCEATVTAAARTGILNRLSVRAAEFPCCEGALARIEVLMRDGSIVGKAHHPYSSSVATNNVADRVVVAVQCALNELTQERATAEAHYDMGVSLAIISGTDSRYGGRPYVTQLITTPGGGPGQKGRDGYLNYAISTGGLHYTSSLEMIERAYPILYILQELVEDGLGAGQWDGAPAVRTVFRALGDQVTAIYVADGHHNPPRGAAGGRNGSPSRVFLASVEAGVGTRRIEELPIVNEVVLQTGQALDGEDSSSGGYGDPLERDPERVRHRVREGWVSLQRARQLYGVVLDSEPELLAVDKVATAALRAYLRTKSVDRV
jgi:N-methylhydantoinase B